ncbi:MAG: ankyrin repeat domain-containing protein [bacterium]
MSDGNSEGSGGSIPFCLSCCCQPIIIFPLILLVVVFLIPTAMKYDIAHPHPFAWDKYQVVTCRQLLEGGNNYGGQRVCVIGYTYPGGNFDLIGDTRAEVTSHDSQDACVKIGPVAACWSGGKWKVAGIYDASINKISMDGWIQLPSEGSTSSNSASNAPVPTSAALFKAVRAGNLKKVRTLIAKGVDMNSTDDDGQTPIMIAVKSRYVEVAKLLIEKDAEGADINAKDKRGDTALMFAAQEGFTNTVKMLIELGADVNATNIENETPLIYATFGGHTKTVKALLDMGANANSQAGSGYTALIIAAEHGYSEIAELLLEKGAEFRLANGMNAYNIAVEKGNTKIVDIIKKGANSSHRLNEQ